jgi:hypothetical protein
MGAESGVDDTLDANAVIAARAGELPTVDKARYVVTGEHARGGLGRILLARDTVTGRIVAIKEMLEGTEDAAARFLREAMVTANLQHPAIVPVYDVGRWPSGEPFYAMKLVVGRSLEEAVAEAKTPEARLALLPHAIDVAEAIAYAHGEGIIHRDLKPQNVLVGAFGETVVIDWGLAKDLRGADARSPTVISGSDIGTTVAGAVLGTPAYMAPEQARGEEANERSDVYAIGALVYHVLAGERPYAEATTVEDVLARVVDGPPRSLERVSGIPPELAAIVTRAMRQRAADRYPSANELAEDLRRFQTGQLVSAHRYSVRLLVRRFLSRYRAAVAVGVAMAVLLAATAIVSVRRVIDERDAARAARARADDERDDAERERAVAEKARADEEKAEAELVRLQAANDAISREKALLQVEYMGADVARRGELEKALAHLDQKKAENDEALRRQQAQATVHDAPPAPSAPADPCPLRICPRNKPLCAPEEKVCVDASGATTPDALTDADLDRGIASVRSALDDCWKEHGQSSSGGQSQPQSQSISVLLEIAPDGQVTGASVARGVVRRPLAICIETVVQTAVFAPTRASAPILKRYLLTFATAPHDRSEDEAAPKPDPCDDVGCAIDPTQACCLALQREAERQPVATLSKDDVTRGMSAVRPRLEACAHEHAIAGDVLVRIVISPQGSVASAQTVGFTGTDAAKTCLESAVKAAVFPASAHGGALTYRIEL